MQQKVEFAHAFHWLYARAYLGSVIYMIDAFFESEIGGCNMIKTRFTAIQWFKTSVSLFAFHSFMQAVMFGACMYPTNSSIDLN